ncbi:MAG: 3-phosphoshikimate 1-carboxyvinyltransferase [Desulfovibrio sp.]|nr:3-phosphoshikimate 1-carboxyvinyltransferase [Desulfovibrio sp.]
MTDDSTRAHDEQRFRPARRNSDTDDSPSAHGEQRFRPVRSNADAEKRARKPLREVICSMDRDILRLLLRRSNLLAKMRASTGRLSTADEKFLREAWESAAARVSRDPRLSGRFFALMQQLEFLPRPSAMEGEEAQLPASREQPRTAFNLAPAQKPVRLHLACPGSCRDSRAWLMLAAATGQGLCLGPCLMNDPLVDCIRMLNEAGARLTRDGDSVLARPSAPLAAADRVLHVGDSAWNFYLLLGHYLGRPSRAKFMGGPELQLRDFSSLQHFLPTLGARFVPVIPTSRGLPARVECSGMLPEKIALPTDVPGELAQGLLLAAPGYEHDFSLDLSGHAQADSILNGVVPILRQAGADIALDGHMAHLHPTPLHLPERPELDMEPELALFLLALPLVLGGEVRLDGRFSHHADDRAGLDLLRICGLNLDVRDTGIWAHSMNRLQSLPDLDDMANLLPTPLLLALTASAALRGTPTRLPAALNLSVDSTGNDPLPAVDLDESENTLTSATIEGFLHAVGLEKDADGLLCKNAQDIPHPIWNAPSPAWTLALALTACASPHLKLGNPGIMTALYPAFWTLYNTLPEPKIPSSRGSHASAQVNLGEQPKPGRRRILTDTLATLPPENHGSED